MHSICARKMWKSGKIKQLCRRDTGGVGDGEGEIRRPQWIRDKRINTNECARTRQTSSTPWNDEKTLIAHWIKPLAYGQCSVDAVQHDAKTIFTVCDTPISHQWTTDAIALCVWKPNAAERNKWEMTATSAPAAVNVIFGAMMIAEEKFVAATSKRIICAADIQWDKRTWNGFLFVQQWHSHSHHSEGVNNIYFRIRRPTTNCELEFVLGRYLFSTDTRNRYRFTPY